MKETKPEKVFMEGPIPPEKIATSIANYESKTNIGAHSIFLGQVRADEIDGKVVAGIDYSAYEEMAEKAFHEIRKSAFHKYSMTYCHIYHSLGRVKTGELCLFVLTASSHRKIAIQSCEYLVEEIKAKVPIFGKEVFEDDTHQWKVNQ